MTVTLDMIARRIGVSKMAVSYALRGSDKVSDRTRRKVMAVAEELEYRPNASARAIRTGRFESVAFLADPSDGNSPFSAGLLAGAQAALAERGMHLVFERLSDEVLGDSAHMPRILTELRVDGLLLNYHTRDAGGMADLVKKRAIPCAWINRMLKADAVYWNDRSAAAGLVQHLVKLGHSRIAYVDHRYHHNPPSNTRHYSKDERLAGYRSAMAAVGHPAILLLDGPDDSWLDDWSDNLLEKLRARQARKAMPTAFISYGGDAISFLSHALQTVFGLSVPGDVSLATFAEVPWVSVHTPHPTELTTMVNEPARLGLEAANILLKKIAQPRKALPAKVLKYALHKGKTTARCRREE